MIKKERLWLKPVLGLLTFLILLMLITVVHVWMVTQKAKNEPVGDQLSRIDFIVKPDSAEAFKIKNYVADLKGVKSTYFNIPDGIYVYTYDARIQSSTQVFEAVKSQSRFKARKYSVNAEALKTGCPVSFNKRSFASNLNRYMSILIN